MDSVSCSRLLCTSHGNLEEFLGNEPFREIHPSTYGRNVPRDNPCPPVPTCTDLRLHKLSSCASQLDPISVIPTPCQNPNTCPMIHAFDILTDHKSLCVQTYSLSGIFIQEPLGTGPMQVLLNTSCHLSWARLSERPTHPLEFEEREMIFMSAFLRTVTRVHPTWSHCPCHLEPGRTVSIPSWQPLPYRITALCV